MNHYDDIDDNGRSEERRASAFRPLPLHKLRPERGTGRTHGVCRGLFDLLMRGGFRRQAAPMGLVLPGAFAASWP